MNDNMNSNLNEGHNGPVVIPADALNEPVNPVSPAAPAPVAPVEPEPVAPSMPEMYTPTPSSPVTSESVVTNNEVPVEPVVNTVPVNPTPVEVSQPAPVEPVPETPVEMPTEQVAPQPEPVPQNVTVESAPGTTVTVTETNPTPVPDTQPATEPVTPTPETPTNQAPQATNPNINVTVQVDHPKKKKHIFRKIFNVIFTLLVLVILANTILAVLNFNQLANKQDPYIFTEVTEKGTKDDGSTYTVYGQGIYKIVHEIRKNKDESWALKPFFLN